MGAKDVIEAKFTHRPHPGLHIVVTLRIGGVNPPTKTWWNRPFHLVVPVPDFIPFDKVEDWWHGMDSPAGVELWGLMQKQMPAFASRFAQTGKLKTYVSKDDGKKDQSPDLWLDEPYIVGYVHANGRQYNIQPFLRDRVLGYLSDEGTTTH